MVSVSEIRKAAIRWSENYIKELGLPQNFSALATAATERQIEDNPEMVAHLETVRDAVFQYLSRKYRTQQAGVGVGIPW